MDCSELIELYNKVGGILTCDYDKKIVTVKNTNLKCDIKSSDYPKLLDLAVDFACSPYQFEHLENKFMSKSKVFNLDIKSKNRYLKNNEYGFEITYLDY